MGLSASTLARAYIEGEYHDQPSNIHLNDSCVLVKNSDCNSSTPIGIIENKDKSVCSENKSNKKARDENQNNEKVNNRNTDFIKARDRKDTLSITSINYTPLSNKGCKLDESNVVTPAGVIICDGNDQVERVHECIDHDVERAHECIDHDVERAHECVVIVGDKDLDLLHRLAKVEARMNAMDEEKEMTKSLMDKDSIIDNLQKQHKSEKETWLAKVTVYEAKIKNLEELVKSCTQNYEQKDTDRIKSETSNQNIRLEKEVKILKEQKKNFQQRQKEKENEIRLCKEESQRFKVSKEAELESYKKVLDECEKMRSDLWYKYDAAMQLLQKTRNENSKATSERNQSLKKSVSTTPRGPSKLPSIFHTGINQNFERVEGMLKRIVVKNGKGERLNGTRKEITGGRLSGTQRRSERGSSQEKMPIDRGVKKGGVQRSKTIGRTLVLEPQLRTIKRVQYGQKTQDTKEQENVKCEQSTDGFKVKGSSCMNKLSDESMKQSKGSLASPQEHSVASLLKRHSLASSRRQIVCETEVVKKILNNTE